MMNTGLLCVQMLGKACREGGASMCGRMIVLTYDEVLDLVQVVKTGPANPYPDWPARKPIEAFPQSTVPIITGEGTGPVCLDKLRVSSSNWGYPVTWSHAPVFNTRIESLREGRGMWRNSAENGRCLVPTLGFYERHGSQKVRSKRTGRLVQRQYEFSLVDESITWLAGISEGDHFSVVTTEPNRFVAPIHHRMPLVLRREELPQWLEGEWGGLANRSDVELAVSAEDERPASPEGEQLSLF
jgi:putative SOS response-associated peptidase YedK